ncbi:MAG: exo-alpha-sialidase [Planctomycetes bacterium]|nr:exo-alpha-sialidase [Planctomycetota bacterium]
MRSSTLVGVFLTLASVSLGQVGPRSPQRVDATSLGSAKRPSIACDDDRVVVAYTDGYPGGTETVWVVTSDGRGVDWSAPVRVDSGPIGVDKRTQADSCAVFGSTVLVAWADERFGGVEVAVGRSTDGGSSFAAEVVLDKGYSVGNGYVTTFRMEVANSNDVYVLLTVQPPTGVNDELYLVSSHDGGATFGPPVQVATAGADVRFADLAVDPVDPSIVQVVWADDRAIPLDHEVMHRRTSDGGSTFGVEQALGITGPGMGGVEEEITIATDGTAVCVAWLDEFSSLREEVRVAFSYDRGDSFFADVGIGGYTPGLDDVDTLVLAEFGFTYYLAWNDDRTGTELAYVTSTSDFGQTWRPEQLVGGDGARVVDFAGDADRGVVGLISTAALAAPDELQLSFTTDGGASWSSLPISDRPKYDVGDGALVYDSTYDNFIAAWSANTGDLLPPFFLTEDVYVGGRRPHVCVPVGWDDIHDPSEPILRFDLENFGDDVAALVAFSFASGPIATGEGRLLDLGPGLLSFGDPAFIAPLSAGSGSTVTIPNVFAVGGTPLGVVVHYGAVGYSAGPTMSRLTDSGRITL